MSAQVVVTRHPALVQLLAERGLIPAVRVCAACSRPAGSNGCSHCGERTTVAHPDIDRVRVIPHATPVDVAHKRVIGVLPLHLAALAAEVTEIPLALGPDDRGKEIGIERLREIAGETQTYIVADVRDIGYGDQAAIDVAKAEGTARRLARERTS